MNGLIWCSDVVCIREICELEGGLFVWVSCCENEWSYGVMVSTLDFESSDPGSNPVGYIFFCIDYFNMIEWIIYKIFEGDFNFKVVEFSHIHFKIFYTIFDISKVIYSQIYILIFHFKLF